VTVVSDFQQQQSRLRRRCHGWYGW
jgi:hypothetical protein